MRQWLTLVSLAALIGLGCSHNATKHDMADVPKPSESSTQPVDKKVEGAKTKATVNEATPNASRFECGKKGDNRILESRAKDKGCELGYTKGGQESVVASSGHGTTYCEKALEKLRDKLKGAGYECK
jgi:hypothetical protein